MRNWQRALVVGASGQVGAVLASAIESRGAEVVRSSRTWRQGWLTLDLAQLGDSAQAASVLHPAAPELILCVGGMTFVDGCEQSPTACFQANALGPAALAAYARSLGAGFVFFSSDYVFSGSPESPGPYDESAPAYPLSVYGRSKLAGEHAVLQAHPGALIVRTTVVYGPDDSGKNFLYTLLRHLRRGERLRVPADQVSTPTYNRDLAAAVLALVDAGVSGVVHVSGPELMDRLQFAAEVAAFFGLDASLVEGAKTSALGQAAARPLASGLYTRRLDELVPSLRRHSLREALADAEPEMLAFLETVVPLPQPALR